MFWMSKKQDVVSLYSIEAEYKATMKGASGTMWLRRMLANLQVEQTNT